MNNPGHKTSFLINLLFWGNLRFLCALTFSVFFLLHSTIWGQISDSLLTLQNARRYITILSHDSLYGRGYQKKGHQKAAHFIAQEFQRLGLRPYYSSYYQDFEIQINLIHKARLKIGNKKLAYGKDFILSANSPPIKGKYLIADEQNAPSHKENKGKKFLIIKKEDSLAGSSNTATNGLGTIALNRQQKARGFILLKPKLTHSFSKKLAPFPTFEVLARPEIRETLNRKKKVTVLVESCLEKIKTQNVIGYVPGNLFPDSLIIVCAHYDHLGTIEAAIFNGANDNASGVAFLLELARKIVERPLKYSVLFIAFGAEETGLDGSFYFVENMTKEELAQVKFTLNFDLLGNGEEGVMAVGGKTYPELFARFERQSRQMQLSFALKTRPNAANSDHYPFTLKKIPALFFYTMGGAPHYHDIYDRAETLGLPIFYDFQRLILSALSE
jgi:hypothetical protein